MSRLITWFTGSPIYHVGIYAGDGKVVEARPRGVVERSLDDEHDGAVFVAVEGPCETRHLALQWARDKIGSPYDRRTVIVMVLERLFGMIRVNITPNRSYSCTELVIEAYLFARCELFPGKPIHRIVPADFEEFLPSRHRRLWRIVRDQNRMREVPVSTT